MSNKHVADDNAEIAARKELGDCALTAVLPISKLAGLHPAEDESGKAVHAGITTYGTPQDQQP
jgi:hypothetical protein